ncbi:MAG: hypothetical protein IOB84_13485 [Brevundimonas sp.]|nr:hypothetical protein [Brevundimonas sp.]
MTGLSAEKRTGAAENRRPLFFFIFDWSGRGDSNARPSPWQGWAGIIPAVSVECRCVPLNDETQLWRDFPSSGEFCLILLASLPVMTS